MTYEETDWPEVKQKRADEFITKLRALLVEFDARLTAEDHYPGYAECGEDIRITVEMQGNYDEAKGDCKPWVAVNVGKWVDATSEYRTL